MKKFVSGVLLSSILLNSGAVPAMAAASSSQTVSVKETKNASEVLIRNYVQYLAGNAQMNQNADVKSKLDAIDKNAEKALAAYQGIKNPYQMFADEQFDMRDEKTVQATPVTSDAFYKNLQSIYDMALAYATSGSNIIKMQSCSKN